MTLLVNHANKIRTARNNRLSAWSEQNSFLTQPRKDFVELRKETRGFAEVRKAKKVLLVITIAILLGALSYPETLFSFHTDVSNPSAFRDRYQTKKKTSLVRENLESIFLEPAVWLLSFPEKNTYTQLERGIKDHVLWAVAKITLEGGQRHPAVDNSPALSCCENRRLSAVYRSVNWAVSRSVCRN